MAWYNKIDRIVLLNLGVRTDRLLDSVEQFEKYQVPFERVEAIHDKEQGARGLRDSMVMIFEDAIENNYDNVLVFEDDVLFVSDPHTFDDTMNKILTQLPETYHICMLGCQPTNGFTHFFSPNLLPVQKAFSTQAVLYSKIGMREIMAREMGFPIDNWLVDEIQLMGHSYCTYPLLASQREGFSDIGMQEISWRPFIEGRYEQKINELRLR